MDHLYQTTMLLPASYAVISEEEMTYLDGGKEILLGSVFGYDITFNTDQFVIFCLSMRSFWVAVIPSVISKILLSAEPTMVCPRLAPSTTPGIR